MNNFILLKRTYPISMVKRDCDGYEYIKKNYSHDDLIRYNISYDTIQKFIEKGEKYIYLVGKENGKFITLHVSMLNFQMIRKNIFKNKD